MRCHRQQHMENRENMILKMIRRFNAAIMKFIMSSKLRTIGATLLGSVWPV